MPGDVRTLTLDFPGHRGLVSNQNRFESDPATWSELVNVYYDEKGRIRKRNGMVSVGSAPAGTVTALYEFVYTSGGSVNRKILRGYANGIQRWSGGAWSAEILPYTATAGNWVFATLNSR